jgi:uncharacterized membrane protein
LVVAAADLTVALQMIQPDAAQLIYRLNPHFMVSPWIFLGLSFGPALFLAPLGWSSLRARAPRAAWIAGALLAVSAVAFLFVDVRGHENTYVSFRTGQFALLLFGILLAMAFDTARGWPPSLRGAFVTLWAFGVVASVPTVALDAYNAHDISNVQMSPGNFPWTVHVSPDDWKAAQWIRAHIPPEATVQPDASAQGRATWALIPAFAEHRVAIGLGLFEPNPRRFDKDIGRIRLAYRSPDIDVAYGYCRRLGVDYLYVGPTERAADAPNTDKFDRDPARFKPVYREGGVTIYKVAKPDAARLPAPTP